MLRGLLFEVMFSALVFGQGCARSSTANTAMSPNSIAEDTSLFAAVVRAIQDHTGTVLLKIDPHPLRAEPDIGSNRRGEARANVSAAVIAQRTRILADLGIGAVDVLSFNPCVSVMVPNRVQESVRACPAQGMFVAAVALPRPGGPYDPNVLDMRQDYAGEEVFSVRVIEMGLSPGGSSEESVDYTMKKLAGNWTLVKRQPLISE